MILLLKNNTLTILLNVVKTIIAKTIIVKTIICKNFYKV